MSPTQVFSNVKTDGVLVRGKQDTGAEINVMPLNIYDQLNLKLKGKLHLKPCNDVKVIGYSKQSVSIVGKVSVICTHANTTKCSIFYVTDLNDTKILLGLNFCKSFDLVKIQCDDQCVCKKLQSTFLMRQFPTMNFQEDWTSQVRNSPDNICYQLMSIQN